MLHSTCCTHKLHKGTSVQGLNLCVSCLFAFQYSTRRQKVKAKERQESWAHQAWPFTMPTLSIRLIPWFVLWDLCSFLAIMPLKVMILGTLCISLVVNSHMFESLRVKLFKHLKSWSYRFYSGHAYLALRMYTLWYLVSLVNWSYIVW